MSKTTKQMSGEELGKKLLQSVEEMKASKAARVTQIAPNEVASARLKAGLSQIQFAEALPAHYRNGSKVAGNHPARQKH